MSGAYYSEFDPKAAAWLRELIKQGHIADGIVDERDLWDVSPTDLKGFTQVHLCAGIGVWSYALRRSGWEDSTECWTASFPCQPFSAAGKGKGFADERHLWPAGHFLIAECRPAVVFGEQVASKDGLDWLDLVQADLEGSGYACGAVDLCAAGLGAPHIRQRLYWTAERLADAAGSGQPGESRGSEAQGQRASERGGESGLVGLEHAPSDGRIERRAEPSGRGAAGGHGDGGLADATDQRHERSGASRGRGLGLANDSSTRGGRGASRVELGRLRDAERVADAGSIGRVGRQGPSERGEHDRADAGRLEGDNGPVGVGEVGDGSRRPGPTNGLWRDADWLFCRDGKWRPVESGTFPLVDGSPQRVGRLRGYGNAIVAPAAQAFIEAYLDARRDAAEAGEAPALQA